MTPTLDTLALWEWAEFAVRWLHVVAAIAWIGSSFYFIALDLGLRKATGSPPGVMGEAWQVHGGGFYHIQKYGVAPDNMPDDLTWFKWEAYTTWLSGALLLAIVYWAGAELFLIDHERRPMPAGLAIAISALVIGLGWVLYDALCRLFLRRAEAGDRNPLFSDTGLFAVVFVFLSLAGWALGQVFTGRAAFVHVGAMTATIMAANVAMVIIPNQRVVVADLIAGRRPDPVYGQIAKQRSLHNNYFTLPVIFLFLANHYPLATSTAYSWAIIALVFLLGVVIRHYFNTHHRTGRKENWTWAVAAGLFVAMIALSLAPAFRDGAPNALAAEGEAQAVSDAGPVPETGGVAPSPLTASQRALVASPLFAEASGIVMGRCSMCHARAPLWDGMGHPPMGVVLETETDIAREATRIASQSAASHAMPPGNVTGMEPGERAVLARWAAGE